MYYIDSHDSTVCVPEIRGAPHLNGIRCFAKRINIRPAAAAKSKKKEEKKVKKRPAANSGRGRPAIERYETCIALHSDIAAIERVGNHID